MKTENSEYTTLSNKMLEEMPFGLLAVDRKTMKKILHMVLYETQPKYIDYCNLYEELAVDEELGCVREDFVIVPIPPDTMEALKSDKS